jgi:predicted transcriptional regulator
MILNRLFSSKTRVKLLTALFIEPEREYYMRELARATDEVIGSVQRELCNLEELNLVVSQRRANAKYFRFAWLSPANASVKFSTVGMALLLP